jgi:hypothetical protein
MNSEGERKCGQLADEMAYLVWNKEVS